MNHTISHQQQAPSLLSCQDIACPREGQALLDILRKLCKLVLGAGAHEHCAMRATSLLQETKQLDLSMRWVEGRG